MANDMLRISYNEVAQLASKINSKSNEARIFLGEIQKVVDEAHNVWQGASSDKFHAEFSNVRNQVQKNLDQYLQDLSTSLKNVAEALRDADQQIANKINLNMK